jgi:hypothetical protein
MTGKWDALIAEAAAHVEGCATHMAGERCVSCGLNSRLATALREAQAHVPPPGWRIIYVKDDFEVYEQTPGRWFVSDDPRCRDFGIHPTAAAAMAAIEEIGK